MKIKLGALKTIIEGLEVLATKELPVKNAYWIGKTISKLGSEFRDCEAARNKLCLKHCAKDDKGNPVLEGEDETKKFNIPNMDAFTAELAELWNMEIEVEFKPIPVEHLEGVKIDSITMMKLDGFIDLGEGE